MDAYPISTEILDMEIYKVTCMVLASSPYRAHEKNRGEFRAIRNAFESTMISKGLVSIAALLVGKDTPKKRSPLDSVGTISVGGVKRPLWFKEATASILSAKEVQLYPNSKEREAQPPLSKVITLKGTWEEEKKAWTVKLDLIRYLGVAASLS